VYNKKYSCFSIGGIKHPHISSQNFGNKRIGEKKMMKNGLEAEIIGYRCSDDIDVRFIDGSIVYGRWYTDFSSSGIAHPSFKNCRGSFCCFELLGDYVKKDGRPYLIHCKCKKCGYEDYLTYDEMLEHSKICEVSK